MIWLIIGFVVAVVIIIKIFCDSWNDWCDKLFGLVITSLLSMCISLIVLLGASAITSCFAEIDYDLVSDTKIIALKDNQNVNGSFYITSGYVNEDLYYYYATETEFGYKTEKIKTDNAYIKYTDGEAHIEKYNGEFANNSAYLWGIPMCDSRYIIYCPDGTVTNEFNIDLE
jgi:hypothetical protein